MPVASVRILFHLSTSSFRFVYIVMFGFWFKLMTCCCCCFYINKIHKLYLLNFSVFKNIFVIKHMLRRNRSGFSLHSNDDMLLLASAGTVTQRSLLGSSRRLGIWGQQRPGYGTFHIQWTAITAWNETRFNQFKQLSKTAKQYFIFFLMMLSTLDHFMESCTNKFLILFKYISVIFAW